MCWGCQQDPEGVVEVELAGSLDDVGGAGVNDMDLGSLRGVLQLVSDLSADDDVSGVLVRVGQVGGGPARLLEVHDSLVRLRDSGRSVHCQIEDASNFAYWLAATSCERVTLSPGGAIELMGLASESYFLLDMLDSLGVEIDVLRMGTHKGAAEFLTRNDMSPEMRETLDELYDDYMEMLVAGIAEGRRLDPAAVRDLIDQGPFAAEHAAEGGLVDALEYRDQSRDTLVKTFPGKARVIERYTERWQEEHRPGVMSFLAGETGGPQAEGERVAVLYLSGTIVDSAGAGLVGDVISLSQVREALQTVREDEDIRALVVRIDSGGGSAFASDEIWHELIELRARRPIVASMGDVAASGGYYIAAAATEVLAQPGTITGSIGVVGGKPVLGDLMERIGVAPEVITRGRNAGLVALSRPFTPSERQALERLMESVYERFIRSVALGRVMDEERVRALATGRVWCGRRALELGLVDRLGGLYDAIVLARELGGLPDDAPVEPFPRPLSLAEQLEQVMDPPSPFGVVRDFAPEGSSIDEAAEASLSIAMLFHREPVLAIWPVVLDVR
jgi:protease-4